MEIRPESIRRDNFRRRVIKRSGKKVRACEFDARRSHAGNSGGTQFLNILAYFMNDRLIVTEQQPVGFGKLAAVLSHDPAFRDEMASFLKQEWSAPSDRMK